jgi:hypothetical protein
MRLKIESLLSDVNNEYETWPFKEFHLCFNLLKIKKCTLNENKIIRKNITNHQYLKGMVLRDDIFSFKVTEIKFCAGQKVFKNKTKILMVL